MSEQVPVGRDSYGRYIYAEALTPEETIERFQASDDYKFFAQKYDTSNPGNQTLLRMLIADRLGDDPNVEDYQRLVRAVVQAGGVVTLRTIKNSTGEVLLAAGQYEFVERPVEEAEPEVETVPVDRNGRPLSQSQIAWGEMARWSQQASSQDIRERRRTDPAFASFYRLNIERESRETESTQFAVAGLPTGQSTASEKLQRFAKLYQELPTDRLKPRGGYITLSEEFKLTKPQFDNFVSQAANAGLL